MKIQLLSAILALCLAGCESLGPVQDIGTKLQTQLADAQKQITGATASKPEKLFEVMGSSTSILKDIFRGTKRPTLQSTDTGFPRVAITYVEWGANTVCWKIRADIWKSTNAHKVELAKVCDVPYAVKDDIGQEAQLSRVALANVYTLLSSDQSRSDWRSTGTDRTIGPIPPKLTWKLNIAGSSVVGLLNEGDRLRNREEAIATRIALISGWHELDKAAKNPAANLPLVKDARLWFVKFESKP